MAGLLVEAMTGLDIGLVHSELKVCLEIIQMCGQEKGIGFAQILRAEI